MGLLFDQAVRLLRTPWANAQLLAEELYAMFHSKQPVKLNGPLVIDNPTSGPAIIIRQSGPYDGAIRIERQPDPAFPTLPGFVWPPDRPIDDLPPGTFQNPDGSLTVPGMPGVSQTFELGAGGSMFTLTTGDGGGNTPGSPGGGANPLDVIAPVDGGDHKLIPSPGGSPDERVPGQGPATPLSDNPDAIDVSGGGVCVPGVVVSGTGFAYRVQIFPTGTARLSRVVDVTQLQIAGGATIPAGTSCVVGRAGNVYFMQVPVWLEDL